MPAQNKYDVASTAEGEIIRNVQEYRRRGRVSDYPPLRTLIAIILALACGAGTYFFARYLKDESGISRVGLAAKNGEITTLKALVASGAAGIDSPGYLGRTAIWWAASSGQLEAIRYCYSKKANINRPDVYGLTPLHAAAMHNRVEAIRLLAQYRAKFDVRDKQGRTLLHAAATGDNVPTILELLKYGFAIDLVDNAGWTPLHVAVSARQPKVVRYLVDHHATVNQKTKDGMTPLALANRMKQNDLIVDILANNGGDI